MRNVAGHLALVPKSANADEAFSGDFASHIHMEYGVDIEEIPDDDDEQPTGPPAA